MDPASVAGQAHQGTVEHFANDLYIVEREQLPSGVAWLSIKRIDKTRVREWRHLQQIKNELAGPEREGVEIFPLESNLVDQADQYHLWVLPEGATFGLGFNEGRIVMTPQDAVRFAKQHGVPPVDQSAWQPGFTTGQVTADA